MPILVLEFWSHCSSPADLQCLAILACVTRRSESTKNLWHRSHLQETGHSAFMYRLVRVHSSCMYTLVLKYKHGMDKYPWSNCAALQTAVIVTVSAYMYALKLMTATLAAYTGLLSCNTDMTQMCRHVLLLSTIPLSNSIWTHEMLPHVISCHLGQEAILLPTAWWRHHFLYHTITSTTITWRALKRSPNSVQSYLFVWQFGKSRSACKKSLPRCQRN